jgi:hypothetical protein
MIHLPLSGLFSRLHRRPPDLSCRSSAALASCGRAYFALLTAAALRLTGE